jgi:anti-sigma factor (TIGR02949 family)
MDCKTALALIDVYLDDELDRADARALETHLDSCTECAAALASADGLRRALRDPALRHEAPQELRERIRVAAGAHPEAASDSNVVAFPPRPRRTHTGWLGIAAACLLAFSAGGVATRQWFAGHAASSDSAQLERDLFASHWRALAASSPVDVVSSDHHTVKPWFAGRIAESPPVQDFAAQGFALAGGRIDYVGTQRVAVLAYRHGQHLVDVYVLPQLASGALAAHVESFGYSADAVMLGTQQAVVVTDMDATELERLAKLLSESRYAFPSPSERKTSRNFPRDSSARSIRHLHPQRHAVHRDDAHACTRRQIRTFHGPERIADLYPSTTIDNRDIQRIDLPDQLLGATIEQRLVAHGASLAENPPVQRDRYQRQQHESDGLPDRRQRHHQQQREHARGRKSQPQHEGAWRKHFGRHQQQRHAGPDDQFGAHRSASLR